MSFIVLCSLNLSYPCKKCWRLWLLGERQIFFAFGNWALYVLGLIIVIFDSDLFFILEILITNISNRFLSNLNLCLVLSIHKGYCVVKKLVCNVRIKAFWYTNIIYFFLFSLKEGSVKSGTVQKPFITHPHPSVRPYTPSQSKTVHHVSGYPYLYTFIVLTFIRS